MINLSWTTGYVAQASKTRVTTGAAVLRAADALDKNTTLVPGVTPEATRSWSQAGLPDGKHGHEKGDGHEKSFM